MFTGIVKGMGTIAVVEDRPGLRTVGIEFPEGYADGLQIGASVAVDGVCLTVTRIDDAGIAWFDLMQETLGRTTLGAARGGSRVNVERSMRVGDEIGGHILSGHVAGTAEIVSVDAPENNWTLTFRVDPTLMRYVLPKGFVALDGCSLTVVDTDPDAATFSVSLIPETLRVTTFASKAAGDRVNVEIDSRTQAIVETVERMMGGTEN